MENGVWLSFIEIKHLPLQHNYDEIDVKSNEMQLIDVRKVIAAKSPKLAKRLPTFVFSWLERIIEQDKLNDLYSKVYQYEGADISRNIIKEYNIGLTAHGMESLDPSGRYLLASNHPLGGMDGICLSSLTSDYFEEVHFLVNDLLTIALPGYRGHFIPVNKTGGQSRAIAEGVKEAFAAQGQLFTFPAGLVSRKQKGKICDMEWKKTFVTKARESKRDIVPIFFQGTNSAFFYNFCWWRKRLGIKINLDMVLLPRELTQTKNSKFDVYFGTPIPWQSLDASLTDQQWAERIKEAAYALPNQYNQ